MNTDIILILGMVIIGLPLIIMGSIAAWRERQHEKQV